MLWGYLYKIIGKYKDDPKYLKSFPRKYSKKRNITDFVLDVRTTYCSSEQIVQQPANIQTS